MCFCFHLSFVKLLMAFENSKASLTQELSAIMVPTVFLSNYSLHCGDGRLTVICLCL